MRQDLKQVIQGFIKTHRFDNNITIPKQMLEYIYRKCLILKLLRATGPTDWYSGELIGDAEAEVPTRLVEQFCVLYKALKSLDPRYPEKSYKNIIGNIIRTSSHPVRYKLYHIFKKQPELWLTIPQLQKMTRLGRRALVAQCEILWNLHSLEKEIREEHVGATGVYKDENGIEHQRGGRIEKIAYYKAIRTKTKHGGEKI
jgi:hypothetical protein